jgi:hypothetical protein
MPFQAPHYIYPTPNPPPAAPDYVGAALSGIQSGLSIRGKMQGMKNDQEDRDIKEKERKRQEELDKEIRDIYQKSEERRAEIQAKIPKDDPEQTQGIAKSEARVAPTQPDAVRMAGGLPEQQPVSSLRNVATESMNKEKEERKKAIEENRMKLIEINADMHNKIIGAHIKHGDYKGAEEIKGKYMANLEKLANIDPEMAEKVWNNSYLKNEYGGIKTKKIDGNWKLEKIDDGSYVKINAKTGEVEPVKILQSSDQVKRLDEGDALVTIDPKTGKVIEIYKNSKPEPGLTAEKAFIQAEIEKGTPAEVAAKKWQEIKNSGKAGSGKAGSGTGGKETALEKNIKFLKGLGLNDYQALAYLEKGRQSKTQFVSGVYRDVLRNEGNDPEGIARAKNAATQAGKYYDEIGGGAPSSGVAAKVEKGEIPAGKVDIATERAKATAAIKMRPDQAAAIKKKFQDITGQPY